VGHRTDSKTKKTIDSKTAIDFKNHYRFQKPGKPKTPNEKP